MNKQLMQLEIKEISQEGTFEGMLSPYGNVDEGGDVVEAGAYTKTLKESGSSRPLLWQHRSDMPIGEIALQDTKEGLRAKGKLLMELPDAQKAYLLIKSGIVRGLSIGFRTIKDSVEGTVRHLKEIKLYEGSIVTFPMNEQALIASVKAGAKFSAETKAAIRSVADEMKSCAESLLALLDGAGEESTPEKAAQPETKQPEPEQLHSVVEALKSIRALIPKTE